MFWARLSRDDFRPKLENISFLSRVMFISKSFSVSRAFVRFGAKRSRSGAFGFDDALEFFFENFALSPGIFSNPEYDHEIFFKVELVSIA